MQADKTQPILLKAGAAQVDITPAAGTALTGFIARLGPSTGIHDRLYARALVFDAGGQRALLVTCDLLALDAAFVSAARAAIQEAVGIPEKNIMLACTHTHSGPATVFLRDCGEVDRSYLDRLRLRLVDAAREALANLREVKMGVGRGRLDKGVLNRRQPGASFDSDVGVLGFQDRAGQVLAVLVNYACHPVCLDHTNRLISADYPGVLARELQSQTHAVVLFTTGAAGDINPEHMGDFAYAEDLGQALAAETLRILETLEFRDNATLFVTSEFLDLPLNLPPAKDELKQMIIGYRQFMAEAEAAGAVLEGKMHRAMLGWAETTLSAALGGIMPVVVPAEIQMISLGDTALLGMPGEIFSELGREIKNYGTPRQVLVLGYTNNDIGYIPTRQAYTLGGYEIDDAYKFYGYPAALAPEAGELVLRTAARMLNRVPN